ncbi:MAG: molybdopterin-dependent oxidoreductase [Alphaproteobacteria bacterium]|nr:molybdopterin-dependent oxidoreductase [Alphaproteobacteria bacterium]
MTEVRHPDGRMSRYPPPEHWDEWVEYDGKAWPKKVPRRYTLVPTICFNCESACGLLAYVDRDSFEIRKFEGNPVHPGSRGRNCAKGPASHNQMYDPERILYPLKRVGERGEGKWKRVSWEEALTDIAAKMRESRKVRQDGIMYHVGRPGEDHYTNRVISGWGVDGHNSHTNICSAAARSGYFLWAAGDRPSPDHANARCILLVSSHLETGHYFNPHAQRIIEAKMNGSKIVTFDPRLSNTAAKSDIWLPTWPGSETVVLLAIARHLVHSGRWNADFVRRWVNWRTFLREGIDAVAASDLLPAEQKQRILAAMPGEGEELTFEAFTEALKALYDGYTFEWAAEKSQVPIDRIQAAAKAVADAGDRVAAHVWRSASMGNRGGWQVARCLFFLNVLTGSVGTEGGTSLNSWNKFVPKPYKSPPAFNAWNDLHLPHEWPFAMYEMSFLLPHFLDEGRGEIDVYFTRVYNPMWINPDGFMWLQALRDRQKMKLHVALTPTWNESAWFADYVLPMGHSGERHDLMSQETHAGMWIGFRQPVRRVAMERAGTPVAHTWEANPGEVWEENEFWVDLTWKMDPDGSMGIRQWVESIQQPGTPVSQDEYWSWIFDHSVPGLPEKAAAEGLTPLQFMRKYGAFEVKESNYVPYEAEVRVDPDAIDHEQEEGGVIGKDGSFLGVRIDGVVRKGFGTPSGKLEFFSGTLRDWGWPELDRVVPWFLESHVDQQHIDRDKGEMILLPNFRLPTLIHTRSANCKWLYEISHTNPVWMNPIDARRVGVQTGQLIRVETEIGWFIDKVWVTEGIKPGIIAMSHHLGRWRLQDDAGGNKGTTALAKLDDDGKGGHTLHMLKGAGPYESPDPDTSRIWWKDVGVHQNLTHPVQPDPVSGHHCWLVKALSVRKALPDERHGDVFVDIEKSRAQYRKWHALTRSAVDHSPDGTRRPLWLKRPLKPVKAAYKLPEKPFGRG